MSPEETKKLIKEAIKEYNQDHPCKLSSGERHMVHAQHEIMDEEGADMGTWRIIIQYGVTVKDVTRKIRNSIILILALIVLAVSGKLIFG